jgi:hypothetical protein
MMPCHITITIHDDFSVAKCEKVRTPPHNNQKAMRKTVMTIATDPEKSPSFKNKNILPRKDIFQFHYFWLLSCSRKKVGAKNLFDARRSRRCMRWSLGLGGKDRGYKNSSCMTLWNIEIFLRRLFARCTCDGKFGNYVSGDGRMRFCGFKRPSRGDFWEGVWGRGVHFFTISFLTFYVSMDFQDIVVELVSSCRSKYLVAQGPFELTPYIPQHNFTMALELAK